MTFKHLAVAAAATTALLITATNAAAQAPARPPVPTGAPIAGICILDKEGVLGSSAVGKFVISRLNQLKAQVDAELQSEASALQTDEKAFEAQRATLAPAAVDQKTASFQIRERDLQRKLQQRQRELQDTEGKALDRISTEVDPIVRNVFTQKSCSLLVNAQALILPAPGMDVTGLVIQQLDAKITQFPFDRERLDATTAAPAPGR